MPDRGDNAGEAGADQDWGAGNFSKLMFPVPKGLVEDFNSGEIFNKSSFVVIDDEAAGEEDLGNCDNVEEAGTDLNWDGGEVFRLFFP